MMNEKQLLELKQQIDDAKTEVATLKGKLQHLNEQLLKEWECKTLQDAEKKIIQLQQEAEKIDKQLQTNLQELEEKYVVDAN